MRLFFEMAMWLFIFFKLKFNLLYFCKDAPGVDGGLADYSMSLTNLPL